MENYNNTGNSNNSAQANFNKEEAYLRAKKKFDNLKGFYWHLTSYIIVNVFLIVMIAINLDADETIWQLRTFATAFFWGIGLAIHTFAVFGTDYIFGKNWEENKINQIMEKRKTKFVQKENNNENYDKIGESNNNSQTNFNKEEAYLRAKKKFKKLKGFYWHLAAYVVVNIFLLVTSSSTYTYENGSLRELETYVTPLIWGIGLAFHALGVYGPDLLFGKNWENRKINEHMNKDKRKWE